MPKSLSQTIVSSGYYYHYLNSWLRTVSRLWFGMCLIKSVFYRPSLIYLEDNARCFCGRTLVATFEGVRETRLQGNKSRRCLSNSSGLRHASLNHTLKYLTVHPVSSPNRKSRMFRSRRITRSSSKAIAALHDKTSLYGLCQLILSYTARCYLIATYSIVIKHDNMWEELE